MKEEASLLRFGRFSFDANDRMLLCDGRRVPLAPKVLQTLLILLRHSGHVVEKTSLMQQVWPDNFVEEGNLAQHIFTLRKVLGDNTDEPQYIETVPGRGYRFVAPVESNHNGALKSASGELNAPRVNGRQQCAELEAQKHYLRGRFFWNKCTKESLEKSLDCFHQARSEER